LFFWSGITFIGKRGQKNIFCNFAIFCFEFTNAIGSKDKIEKINQSKLVIKGAGLTAFEAIAIMLKSAIHQYFNKCLQA